MFCMNCGQDLPEGAKFCKRCGTPLGAVSPDGEYTPEPEESGSGSESKLGSFSVDGEDTGERLPLRSDSGTNYYSMMGSMNKPNPAADEQPKSSEPSPFKAPAPAEAHSAPSPFKHAAEKHEEAPSKAEAPKEAAPAPINSAFKPAAKKEEPEEKPASSGIFGPIGSANREAPKETAAPSPFKPAQSEKKEAAAPSAFKPAAKKEEEHREEHKKEPFPGAFSKPEEPVRKDNSPNPEFLKRLGLTKEDIEPSKDHGTSSSLPLGGDDNDGPKLGSFDMGDSDGGKLGSLDHGDSDGGKLGSFDMGDSDGGKLGSFGMDDDSGETLPQRSDSGNNYYNMMSSMKPNPAADESKMSSENSPFKPAGAKETSAAPSPFKHTAAAEKKEEPVKAETPKPAAPINSAFKPAGAADSAPSAFKPAAEKKAEKAPKPAAPFNGAFKPAEPAKTEAPGAFKPAAAEQKEEAPKEEPKPNPFTLGINKNDFEAPKGSIKESSSIGMGFAGSEGDTGKLGSYSLDGEDSGKLGTLDMGGDGETLPQHEDSASNYYSMMGSMNAAKPAVAEAPKPANPMISSAFKPAAAADSAPSAFKPAANAFAAKDEPSPFASSFKPAAEPKKTSVPEMTPEPISNAFKPIGAANKPAEEPAAAFKAAEPVVEEEPPKAPEPPKFMDHVIKPEDSPLKPIINNQDDPGTYSPFRPIDFTDEDIDNFEGSFNPFKPLNP